MATLCKTHFLQQMYRKIDGAVLRSQNERNLDCVITLQTETILQRFMLRFEQLQLDCNDHLFIYDGAHAIGNYKVRTRRPVIAPSAFNLSHSIGRGRSAMPRSPRVGRLQLSSPLVSFFRRESRCPEKKGERDARLSCRQTGCRECMKSL